MTGQKENNIKAGINHMKKDHSSQEMTSGMISYSEQDILFLGFNWIEFKTLKVMHLFFLHLSVYIHTLLQQIPHGDLNLIF